MATNNAANIATAATGTVLVGEGLGVSPAFTATPTVTSITINNAPSAGTDGTNKTYVDNAIAAVNPATSVLAASTAALTVTYSNGVGGIGATLTNAGTQAAFSLDGQSPTVGQRVLIKDQASTFQNGVYTVTVVGTGATNWVLTRAIDYDQPSDINSTGVINVLNGTVNALTGWLINSSVTTIGTDAITYTKYSNAPITTTQYDVLVGAANNGIGSVGPGTALQILQSGGNASNPAYSTSTYPATNAVNTLLYASSANVMAALATANNGVLITSAGGVPSYLAAGTTGQVLTATTGSPATWAAAPTGSSYSLQAGSGVSFASPADSTTYYVGPFGGTSPTWATIIMASNRIFIPKTGTITQVYGAMSTAGTLATSENVTIAIRLNDTTNTNITTTCQMTAAFVTFNNSALSISVSAGDFISFIVITPAWATNPTAVFMNATAFVT